MIRLRDFHWDNEKYEIYLTEDTSKKADEVGIHEGIFQGAATRLITHINKKINSFYYAEQNVLLYIEVEEPNKLIFLDIKRLNIFENRKMTGLKDPIRELTRPTFFKSYEDGRKVFLNEDLPLKMKKMRIPAHYVSLKNVIVLEGSYSMFDNGLILDFYFTDDQYYITNIIKPDFINFGLALLKN